MQLHGVFKDIRYCFYKNYDKNTDMKYSKSTAINEIFQNCYPNLAPESLKHHAENLFHKEVILGKIKKDLHNKDKNKPNLPLQKKMDSSHTIVSKPVEKSEKKNIPRT